MQSVSPGLQRLCCRSHQFVDPISIPLLQQFHLLHFPAALHEMLGFFGSNPSASTSSAEPAEAESSSPKPPPPAAGAHGDLDERHHSLSLGTGAGVPMQLRDLLFQSARAVSNGDWDRAHRTLGLLSRRISSGTGGDSAERVASCFTEALAARFSRATATEVKFFAAPPQEPSSEEVLSAYLALNQVTPFVRFAHLTANQALLEALSGEDFVHIVDLDIGHGVQWPPFMQALADMRSELGSTPPHIRITGVGKERHILDRTGRRLADFAQSVQIPFEFIPLVQSIEALDSSMLGLRMGEAVAVNCMLQLHRLLSRGSDALTSFLRMLFSLAPKVITLAEREASHNQPFFLDRFAEAVRHYSTLFDTLEATLPPTSAERVKVEQAWLRMEIVNIVACEGVERVVRHQRFGQWRRFMERAGFRLLPTSTFALSQARLLLRLHYPSDGYRLVEDDGCLLLGWQDHPLFAVSSWHIST